jgi:type IV secretion system protein VirB4
MIKEKNRKADNNLFKSASAEYIPIACHYDESTLLTKNGELIQTIVINGLNSERISENLINLRDMVRQAISNNVKSDKFAFWIHTVRKKTNLDDNTPYSQFFSRNLHDIWRQKNYWHDKFVNNLYITLVYSNADLNVTGLKSFLSSLTFSLTKKFHEEYLEQAHSILSNTFDKIINSLKEFGAKKLSISFEKDGCYSELLLLYGRIVHLYENKIHMPCRDLSEALATHKYAIGGNKLEVIDAESKKFATVLSLKEYQEVSTEELDLFLQLPIEMIASEVFYFIPKSEALKEKKYHDYILQVSQDEELRNWKGLRVAMEASEVNSFCNQQISIAIIGNDVNQLEQDTFKASKVLSQLGIMHVREDIGLEQAFWVQLPGNFQFLKRLSPALTSKVASFASLHNSPTGVAESKWGKFVTLLRTEKGTPYFMNFHTGKESSGHTGIFGVGDSGRTVLMNFLLSEATKFNPAILYLATDNTPEIFIKALEGTWIDMKLGDVLLNPFICETNKADQRYLAHIIKLLFDKNNSNHELDEAFVDSIINFILSQNIENRNIHYLVENFDFLALNAEAHKDYLMRILKEGNILNTFNTTQDIDLELNNVIALNLKEFTEKDFESKNYPSDPKLRVAYLDKLEALNKVRFISLLTLIHKFTNIKSTTPKIIAIDNIFKLLDYGDKKLINELLDAIHAANGMLLTTVNIEDHDRLLNLPVWKDFYQKLATRIILASEVVLDDLDKLLELSHLELKKLKSLKPLRRLFMIKQLGNTIVAELSLGGIPGVLKLLSAKNEYINIANSLISQKGSKAEDWLEEVYETFNKQE